MNLDPRTVTILIVVGSMLMGGGLFAVTRGHLGRIDGGSRWATATLIQAFGWMVMGPLRGVVPDLISIVIGHGLLTLSLALFLIVLAEFSGRPIRSSLVYGVVALQSAVLTWFVAAGQSAAARTVVVSACAGALMLKSSHVLLSGPERRLPSHVFTAAMFATCGAMMLARAVYEFILATDPSRAPNPMEGAMNDVTFLIFYVTATLLTFGFVLMLSDRYTIRQEQAEGTLRASEARFRQLSESTFEGIVIHHEGILLDANQAFCRLLGRERSDLIGAPVLEFLAPESRDLVQERIRTGYEKPYECAALRKDGSRVEVEVVGRPIQYQGRLARVTAVRDITERRQTEASLQASLREKETLLKEVHHRVKNNLALITSLMRLEERRSQKPETKQVLQEMQGRTRSVVLLNETLYRTGSYTLVKLGDYLRQIATHLFQAQNANTGAVLLALDLGPVDVLTNQAIPCGLIVNELVTNSLKHAFPEGRSGEVRVGLREEADGRVRLWVSDTGAGPPSDLGAKSGGSLGLQLVSDLVRQLHGVLDVGPGATFTVTFPLRLEAYTVEIPSPR